jgi:3-methylcrotonyl-CoA carboxylase alpha subunit
VLTDEAAVAANAAAARGDPYSPWHASDHWWLNSGFERELPFSYDEVPMPVAVRGDRSAWWLRIGDQRIVAMAKCEPDGRLNITLDGVRERVSVLRVDDTISVRRDGETWRLRLPDPIAAAAEEDEAGGRLIAPLPGQVTQVMAEPGMVVSRGQVMVVLEAMKTVFRLPAPADGTIATVSCRVGDNVVEGQLLVAFAEDGSPSPD